MAITSLKKNPKVNIYGNDYNTRDGTCIRDYIHVSDLADIPAKFIQNQFTTKKSYIVNCGYGRGYTVKEVVDIFKLIKKMLLCPIKKEDLAILGRYLQIQKNKKSN